MIDVTPTLIVAGFVAFGVMLRRRRPQQEIVEKHAEVPSTDVILVWRKWRP